MGCGASKPFWEDAAVSGFTPFVGWRQDEDQMKRTKHMKIALAVQTDAEPAEVRMSSNWEYKATPTRGRAPTSRR